MPLSAVGTTVAAQKAKFRRQFGVPVTPLSADGTSAGAALWMRTRSLEKREREYLPEGFQNAADADLRVFEASPVDFQDPKTKAAAWPAVGSLWSWHGLSYTVMAVHPGDDEIGGVPITLEVFVYKEPAPDSVTLATDAEQRAEDAAAGAPDAPEAVVTPKRKVY